MWLQTHVGPHWPLPGIAQIWSWVRPQIWSGPLVSTGLVAPPLSFSRAVVAGALGRLAGRAPVYWEPPQSSPGDAAPGGDLATAIATNRA